MKTLTLETDAAGIATLTLNRPEKRNAMNGEMIAELSLATERLGADRAVRAVVLRGAGTVFCAGGDLEWMKMQIAADREGRMQEARRLAQMLKALNEMPKPLIGRIHGAAMGGGVGLACVCDVAIAQSGTRFGLTETRLGLIPATIGPYVAARMGEGRARRVFMSSRIFEAEEAEALGIIARVAPPDALGAAVAAETAPYLAVAPEAVGRAKRLLRGLGPRIDAETIERTIEALADTWEAEEAAAGIDAFFKKVPPPWAS